MNYLDLPAGVSTASAVLFFFREYLGFWLLISTLLGLSVGSFLNVVIHRLPLMLSTPPDQPRMNLCFPRSHCPKCGTPIAARDNIPVVGYVLLGGRCRHCQSTIGLRYPLVELITSCLTMVSAWILGPSWTCFLIWLLLWTCLAASFIFWDSRTAKDI